MTGMILGILTTGKHKIENVLSALSVPYTPTGIPQDKDPDFLTFADTLDVFRAFILQQPRPARYHWRHINDEI